VSESIANVKPEVLKAFQVYETQERIANTRVGAILVVTLMPLGSTADFFVYRPKLLTFFVARLICTALAAGIWAFLFTEQGRRWCKWLGRIVPLLPVVFLAWMIAVTDGFASSYYAALNLVLLAVGAVLHWTFWESVVAVFLVLVMYVSAGCWCGNYPTSDVMFSNFYFIALMDIICVVGTYYQEKARYREFTLRYQLNQQNEQLDRQNKQIKEAEAQLVQTEKLASLGRMSAGIIHEINNPLNFVKTGLYTLKKQANHLSPERQADYTDTLKDLEDGFDRVVKIVSSLRGFSHHDDEVREEVPVANLVDESLRFVSHEWSSGVKLERQLTEGQTIYANKNKLIQVCLNLLENSLDALKTKEFHDGEAPFIRISSRVENGRNFLVFYDNGPGIPPENLGKIFDPFFTTKDVGEGMGMGLSICYRIIQQFEGDIRAQSEPGKYCEFTLEFPVKA
jgi:two-component system sensor histidine kinase PhcS